jgi:hypothetical protein
MARIIRTNGAELYQPAAMAAALEQTQQRCAGKGGIGARLGNDGGEGQGTRRVERSGIPSEAFGIGESDLGESAGDGGSLKKLERGRAEGTPTVIEDYVEVATDGERSIPGNIDGIVGDTSVGSSELDLRGAVLL